MHIKLYATSELVEQANSVLREITGKNDRVNPLCQVPQDLVETAEDSFRQQFDIVLFISGELGEGDPVGHWLDIYCFYECSKDRQDYRMVHFLRSAPLNEQSLEILLTEAWGEVVKAS